MRMPILFLFATLMLSSCVFSSSKTPVTPEVSSSGTSVVSYKEDITKASPKIKDTPEFENCMKPSVAMCVNQVGNELARAQKSEAFCAELSDDVSKEACRYGIVMTRAIEEKNKETCGTLSDIYKRECRAAIIRMEAGEKSDLTLCDTLSAEYPTGTGADASMVTMQLDQCKLNVIQSSSKMIEADCEKLSDTNTIEMCKNIIKNRPKLPVTPPVPTSSSSSGTEVSVP